MNQINEKPAYYYKDMRQEEPRYFNLHIKNGTISPCTIQYGYKQKNELIWNGKKLEKESEYYYSLGDIVPMVGDRLILVIKGRFEHIDVKTTIVEVIQVKKKSLRLVEISRNHLKLTCVEKEEKDKILEFCPTCNKPV